MIGKSRFIFLLVFSSPFIVYIGGIDWGSAVSLSFLADRFDKPMWIRFFTSIGLGLLSAVFAIVWGVLVYAGYLCLTQRLRPVLKILALLPLSYPAFGVATAWITSASWQQAFSGKRIIGGGESLLADWLYSLPGAAWVLSMCWWPVVFFLLMLQKRPTRRQIEAAKLHIHKRLHWLLIFWRAWRPTIFLGGAIVFGLGMTQFEVPSLLQVNAYALEIYVRFSAMLDETGGLILCLPYLILCLFFTWIGAKWGGTITHSSHQEPHPFHTSTFRAILLIATGLLLVLSCIFPLLMMIVHASSTNTLLPNIAALLPVTLRSLGYSCGTALLIFLLAMWFQSKRSVRLETISLAYGFFCFFLPGILIGSAWLQFRSYWPGMLPNGLSIASMVWAFGFHNWLPALGASILLWRHFGQRPKEASNLLPLSHLQRFYLIYWPHFFRPSLLAVLLVSLFVWREVAIPVLMHPPGGDTLAMQYFNRLHYGSEPITASVGLMMLLSPALLLFLLIFVLHFFHKETNR